MNNRTFIIMPVQEKKPLTDITGWGIPYLMDGLSPHDRSRSYLISRALIEAPDAEVFVWIDDDTECTKEQVLDLVSSLDADGSDLVSGVYVCRHAAEHGSLALNFNLAGDPTKGRRIDVAFYEDGDRYPIVACGFGFVATHRRMFEPADAPEADYESKDGRSWAGAAHFFPLMQGRAHLGEDRSFCLRHQGARMMVDTRLCVGHAGHTLLSVIQKARETTARE